MTAHVTLGPPDADLGGIERTIARRMPGMMLGGVIVLVIAWWMAAQPPQQPPPWDQAQQAPTDWAPGQFPPGDPRNQMPPPRPPQNTGCGDCSACVAVDCGDCASGIDCGDCVSGLDCGDCSGLDCGSCAVARTGSSALISMKAEPAVIAGPAKSCSTQRKRAGRLAESSGLLLPLLVLVGWRRRLRR